MEERDEQRQNHSLDDLPGTQRSRGVGILTVRKGEKTSRLPLAGVDIAARVANRVAEVSVKQKFSNPFSEHLEATYIFPLPGGCAVSKFTMKVGERIITGCVNERTQARQEYAQALQEGRRAALMEQERDDVFTVQVGNIPPRQEIEIELTYSERLSFFSDGTTEIRLPLVVAPRYIPGQELPRDSVGQGIEFDTDIVPDASRITPPRLAAGFDPQVSLNIEVELIPTNGAQRAHAENLFCSQHTVRSVSHDGSTKITLSKEGERFNRDFVLRWRLAEKKLKSGFVYYKDTQSNWCYGMLSLVPPQLDNPTAPPRDVVFVWH